MGLVNGFYKTPPIFDDPKAHKLLITMRIENYVFMNLALSKIKKKFRDESHTLVFLSCDREASTHTKTFYGREGID